MQHAFRRSGASPVGTAARRCPSRRPRSGRFSVAPARPFPKWVPDAQTHPVEGDLREQDMT